MKKEDVLLKWRFETIEGYYSEIAEAERIEKPLTIQFNLREMLNMHIRYYLYLGGKRDISKFMKYYV